jgi:YD repeat-containing protein
MRRPFSLVLVFVVFFGVVVPCFLPGQDTGVQIPAEQDGNRESLQGAPFPLGPILLTADQKDIAWRPDWGVTIPPDAFTLRTGKLAAITLILEGTKYRVCWKNGSLVEFPVWLQGSFAQVQMVLRTAKKIKSLTIKTDISWNLEVIRNEDSYRSLARLTGGEQVYFIVLQSDHLGISETWYDPEGKVLGFFSSRSRYAGEDPRIGSLVSYTEGDETRAWYEYDSFGNISEIVTDQSRFSAFYYQKNGQKDYFKSYPRYWECQSREGSPEGVQNYTSQYTLQWDEQGFLVRMVESAASNSETAVDSRYEYTLDKRGNWTERQEIRMIRRLGVLVPSPGLTIKRLITYEPEA